MKLKLCFILHCVILSEFLIVLFAPNCDSQSRETFQDNIKLLGSAVLTGKLNSMFFVFSFREKKLAWKLSLQLNAKLFNFPLNFKECVFGCSHM